VGDDGVGGRLPSGEAHEVEGLAPGSKHVLLQKLDPEPRKVRLLAVKDEEWRDGVVPECLLEFGEGHGLDVATGLDSDSAAGPASRRRLTTPAPSC